MEEELIIWHWEVVVGMERKRLIEKYLGDTFCRTWWSARMERAGNGCLVWMEENILNWDKKCKRTKDRAGAKISSVLDSQRETLYRPYICHCYDRIYWSDLITSYSLAYLKSNGRTIAYLSLCLAAAYPAWSSGISWAWSIGDGEAINGWDHPGRDRKEPKKSSDTQKKMFTPWGENLRNEWPGFTLP